MGRGITVFFCVAIVVTVSATGMEVECKKDECAATGVPGQSLIQKLGRLRLVEKRSGDTAGAEGEVDEANEIKEEEELEERMKGGARSVEKEANEIKEEEESESAEGEADEANEINEEEEFEVRMKGGKNGKGHARARANR